MSIRIMDAALRDVFFLVGAPVSWCSQKQETVVLSSCEAEFMAATSATCQAIWLRGLLGEMMDTGLQTIEIRVDNKSAMALAKNPVFHGRSKHIDTRYHFTRESIEKKQVVIEYISGSFQRADIFTKPLGRIKFAEMRDLLGVKNQPNPNLGLGGSCGRQRWLKRRRLAGG
ncbi:hypothetical protein E3N88_32938 [Mikania micrantha]|uniref:Reverse transcriptase Ty1/copia-type domain-containing protein n=1 Tax=Mikania micrantha TaxID=192012 RepID=A0A5N6MCI0_9ASTR|nr:hypothetical protein E3N88_32938 [Mikania micrantha]